MIERNYHGFVNPIQILNHASFKSVNFPTLNIITRI